MPTIGSSLFLKHAFVRVRRKLWKALLQQAVKSWWPPSCLYIFCFSWHEHTVTNAIIYNAEKSNRKYHSLCLHTTQEEHGAHTALVAEPKVHPHPAEWLQSWALHSQMTVFLLTFTHPQRAESRKVSMPALTVSCGRQSGNISGVPMNDVLCFLACRRSGGLRSETYSKVCSHPGPWFMYFLFPRAFYKAFPKRLVPAP